VTEPTEKDECTFNQPVGVVQVNQAPVVEVGFNSTDFASESCEGGAGSKKTGFELTYVEHTFGVTLVFESFKPYAKIKLASTCFYNIKTVYAFLTLPTQVEATTEGHLTLSSGTPGCAKERTITAMAKLYDKGSNDELPFWLVEEE
jgi:hypothetical protein